jgi:hypothetical protein
MVEEVQMALIGFYTDQWWIEARNNDLSAQTADFEFDIIPSVEAYSMLTAFSHTEGDISIVTSGILEYTTRDPATGVDTPVPVGTLEPFQLENLILARNVVRVTFGVTASDSGGAGFFATRGDVVNQVWLWD